MTWSLWALVWVNHFNRNVFHTATNNKYAHSIDFTCNDALIFSSFIAFVCADRAKYLLFLLLVYLHCYLNSTRRRIASLIGFFITTSQPSRSAMHPCCWEFKARVFLRLNALLVLLFHGSCWQLDKYRVTPSAIIRMDINWYLSQRRCRLS